MLLNSEQTLLKAILILAVLGVGIVGVLWASGVTQEEQSLEYARRVLSACGVLGLVSVAVNLILGRNKNKKSEETSKQGPQF